MVQALYGLWLARNEAQDGKRIKAPHEILATVLMHMEEWRLAHPTSNNIQTRQPPQPWEPLAEGWTKVNSDGATSKLGSKAGEGAVLRDHMGAFRAGVCHLFSGVTDPEVAELLACRRALEVASDINVQRVHVELDSNGVVRTLQNEAKELSSDRTISGGDQNDAEIF